jgi:NADPH:quinone reductase-like Zn-dependent oxidoreductase
MKAIVYTKYGPPDVLHLEEVKKPAFNEDQVLVRGLQHPSMRETGIG